MRRGVGFARSFSGSHPLRSMVNGDSVKDSVLIVDTDVGFDDLFGIALLISHGVKPALITTVHGMASTKMAASTVRRLLAHCGQPTVAVVQGAERGLDGSKGGSIADQEWGADYRKQFERFMHSAAFPREDEETSVPSSCGVQGAADAIYERAKSAPEGKCKLLCLGPLTNLAVALDSYPDLPSHVEVVVMGGAVRAPGNAAGNAELNMHLDPVAAQKVVHSGIKLTMCCLATANESGKERVVEAFGKLGSQQLAPAGDAMRALVQEMPSASCYDPVVCAGLLSRKIWETEAVTVCVNAATGETTERLDDGGARIALAVGFSVDEYVDVVMRGATAGR